MQNLTLTFGEFIRTARHVRGISLTELSMSLGINSAYLSMIENNWKRFPKDRLNILADEFLMPIREVEKEFIKNDIIQQYGGFISLENALHELVDQDKKKISTLDLIQKGESGNVEFKSSIRYCLKKKTVEKYIEHSSIKNICAFLNSSGGKLLIGVSDEKEILGLEGTDFTTFSENDKKDAFLKHLDNLISKYLGNNLNLNILTYFEEINSKTIVCIDVLPYNTEPVFLKNPEKNNLEEFYIRRNASTVTLSMTEFHKYVKERW